MFCPLCKAEYRQGFTYCADCDVDLVEALPTVPSTDPTAPENDHPHKAPPVVFLAWFLPMAFFGFFLILLSLRPQTLPRNPFFEVFLVSFIFVANMGAYWMLYQSLRYEKRVGRYVLLSMVPFMFVWYLLVRYPLRQELPRLR
jgi:hypothetical protein